MAKSLKKSRAARKGHRNTTRRKSHAGVRKAAWSRWGRPRRKRSR